MKFNRRSFFGSLAAGAGVAAVAQVPAAAAPVQRAPGKAVELPLGNYSVEFRVHRPIGGWSAIETIDLVICPNEGDKRIVGIIHPRDLIGDPTSFSFKAGPLEDADPWCTPILANGYTWGLPVVHLVVSHITWVRP